MDVKNKQKSGDIEVIKDGQFNVFAESLEGAANEKYPIK